MEKQTRTEMTETESLFSRLQALADSDLIPLHMPGHKRRGFGELPEELAALDITEIEGFDNLHEPEGILKAAQERAAQLCGAQETCFLVGGGSSGVLTAICGAVSAGGEILLDRDAHRSAYHALYLRGIQPKYLKRELSRGGLFPEAVTPEEVERGIRENPRAQAVFLVSPTYEGRIADIARIAKIVHAAGKLLIVDEAHGAHLPFLGGPAQSAVRLGADLVIQSTHKTLPAPTQTALLHICSDRADAEAIHRFLRIYQSSSPSYPLMAGIDNAMRVMKKDGQELCKGLKQRFELLLTQLSELKFLQIRPTPEECREGIHDYGKLVIGTGGALTEDGIPLTGMELSRMLRKEYGIETEMALPGFVLAMFTVGDVQAHYDRLQEALTGIDGRLREGKQRRRPAYPELLPEAALSIREAWDADQVRIPLESAQGRISGDFVGFYPPGSPVLVPGERIGQQQIDLILRSRAGGFSLQGILTKDGETWIKVPSGR